MLSNCNIFEYKFRSITWLQNIDIYSNLPDTRLQETLGLSVSAVVVILYIETESIWHNNKNKFLWFYLVLSPLSLNLMNKDKCLDLMLSINQSDWVQTPKNPTVEVWLNIKMCFYWLIDMSCDGDNAISDGRFDFFVIMMKHYSHLCHMCMMWKCWKHWRHFLVLHFFGLCLQN